MDGAEDGPGDDNHNGGAHVLADVLHVGGVGVEEVAQGADDHGEENDLARVSLVYPVAVDWRRNQPARAEAGVRDAQLAGRAPELSEVPLKRREDQTPVAVAHEDNEADEGDGHPPPPGVLPDSQPPAEGQTFTFRFLASS